EDIETRKHCGEIDQIELPAEIERRNTAESRGHLVDQRTIAFGPRQDDRGVSLTRQLARDVGESIEMPLLRFPTAARMHADEGPSALTDELDRASLCIGRKHQPTAGRR